MVYRGEDLDLRTLPSWTAQGREPQDLFAGVGRAGIGTGRGEPLWVDDVVLACINDAYDIAVAHRAGDIRLEHLLNAMTRIEAAAKTLDMSGVRVSALRRETAAIIASDVPVTFANGKAAPRTSAEVEDVLRLATEIAYARRAPVSIEDLLTVLVETKRDVAGLQVLRRNLIGRTFREPSPLPPLGRIAFQSDEPRERVRAPARSSYIAEPPRMVEPAQVMTDSMQTSRIEALERLVRELAQDLGGERKVIQSLVAEMHRDVVAGREDTSRLGGSVADRLHGLEQTIAAVRAEPSVMPAQLGDRLLTVERSLDQKFSDLGRSWTVLGERLQGLEQGVHAMRTATLPEPVDIAPIERQMGELQRTLASLGERLGQIERQTARGAAPALELITERLQQIERSVQSGMGEGARNWAAMSEKMKSVERAVTSRPDGDLTPIMDRIALLEAKLGEPGRNLSQIGERLRTIEDAFATQRSALGDLTTRLGGEVKAVAAALGAQQSQADRVQTLVSERVQSIAGVLERQRGDVAAAVGQQVGDRFTQLTQIMERRQVESIDAARQSSDRIGRLETGLKVFSDKMVELQSMRDKDLIDLHDALVKINTNQQTLAGSMDQWRLDTAGDLSVVSNRLDAMDKNVERPVQLLQQLSADMQVMNAHSLRREQRKSRFRMWLFGTEDWYGDSWADRRDQVATAPAPAAKPRAGWMARR
jgi:hypothetical protein